MLTEEDYISIDLYLFKKLKGNEKIAFETELRSRPELMEEVRFQFKLLKGLQEREREVLRVFLAQVKNENSLVVKERTLRGKIIFLWQQNSIKLAIAASIICVLGFVYYLMPTQETPVVIRRTHTQSANNAANGDSTTPRPPREPNSSSDISRQTQPVTRPSNHPNETIREVTITYIDRSINPNYGAAPRENLPTETRNFSLRIQATNREFNDNDVVGTFVISDNSNEIRLFLNANGRFIANANPITGIEKTGPYRGHILSGTTVILILNYDEHKVYNNN